jgi:hypothetical protein
VAPDFAFAAKVLNEWPHRSISVLRSTAGLGRTATFTPLYKAPFLRATDALYLRATLTAIANKHPKSRIDDLMQWAFQKKSS